jgi:hypothetical protein
VQGVRARQRHAVDPGAGLAAGVAQIQGISVLGDLCVQKRDPGIVQADGALGRAADAEQLAAQRQHVALHFEARFDRSFADQRLGRGFGVQADRQHLGAAWLGGRQQRRAGW